MSIFLERILFYLLIFFLPFQTRKIIYQWGGSFNEWTSAYLYLTDILLVLLFFFWAWRLRKERFLKDLSWSWLGRRTKTPDFWIVTFLTLSLISVIQATNLSLSFYFWFKFLEMIGLFFYLKCNFKNLFNFNKIAGLLVISAFFQALFGLAQFINQKSLGWQVLTESPLSSEAAGVAKVTVGGLKIIRAYGGLPHPNLLAAFLLLGIFAFYFLWLGKKRSFFQKSLLIFIFGLLVFVLYLTFSRLIISVFILASTVYLFWNFWRAAKESDLSFFYRNISLFLLFLFFSFLWVISTWSEISSRFLISFSGQSVYLRNFYNEIALAVLEAHPFLGIGLGNFVWQFRESFHLLAAWVHQPVHNIYLLIASEVGLMGLVVLLLFLFQLFRKSGCIKKTFLCRWLIVVASSFLFIGLFDHFFWTLQQGQLMFWLVLGLLAGYSSDV
jgi:O-antigen ligase